MYDIFEKLMRANGYTAYKVSVETGIAQSTLSDWKKGKSTPKTDKLQKIADLFGVSLEYLTTGEESKLQISERDKALLLSGANAVLDEIFGDILEEKQMEELTRRVQEQLPADFGISKPATIAARFEGDEFTEEELDEIRQFAEFVKNKRKQS